MKLQELFAIFPFLPQHSFSQMEVTNICHDARKVTPGSVFIAIVGSQFDGHQFLAEAVQKGAIALVVEKEIKTPENYSGLVFNVPDTRQALDVLAARFYWNPGYELFCVGITGTNGKTSTSYMVESVLNRGGLSCGVIGTVNHHLGEQVWPSEMTTPDPVFLQKRLREFRQAGAKAIALEVSSHALEQKRVESVPFNTVIFTNLTRDHLDYHKSMAEYFAAKQRLFRDLIWSSMKVPSVAIINTDDPYGRRLNVAAPAALWTYGEKEGDFRFTIKQMNFASTEFELKTPAGNENIILPMSGRHNVQNAVAAIAAGLSAGVSLMEAAWAIGHFTGVPGRLQSVPNAQNISVFVDYAHSPDALENVLRTLAQVRKNLDSKAKIWTLFGCGGDRDKGKRPLMLQAAMRYSDRVMVTSDNPRTEEPQAIINDILAGTRQYEKDRILVEIDRKSAIAQVLQQAKAGDVVLIAGKGHENYQIIGTEKIFFSDVQVVQDYFMGGQS